MSPNYPENKATPTLREMSTQEAALYRCKGLKEGGIPLIAELSAIAGPELGLLPAMTVDKEGIWITREEDGQRFRHTYSSLQAIGRRNGSWTLLLVS